MATKHINPSHKRKATVNFDLLRATLDQIADMIAERTAELKQQNDELSAAVADHRQRRERGQS
jgi:C4-dicarboxylate-specific signal transduction histidine kinase